MRRAAVLALITVIGGCRSREKRSEAHAQAATAAPSVCAMTCAKASNAIAILDSKGTLYMAAGIKDHQPARDVLIEKMGQNVAATGTLVKKGGLQMCTSNR